MTLESEPIWYRGRAFRADKQFFDGTHRTCSPAATLGRIRPVFALAGITRLAEIDGLDRIGIPVSLAIRPNSWTLSQCSGKGFTREASLVSGAMEAIELFHIEEVTLPAEERAYQTLAGGERIPLHRLPLARHSLFDERRSLPLAWAWDLVHQREVAVPTALVEMGRSTRRGGFDRFVLFQASTTGLASGNHFLEALLHALLETIERDAASCRTHGWFKHGITPRRVALETVTGARVQALMARLDGAGIDTLLLDHTMDIGVPVYGAYLVDRLNTKFGIYGGYGAHLDPEVAMVRALTEAVQSRAVVISGSRDDFFRDQFRRLKAAGRTSERALASLIPTVDARQRTNDATGTFEGDIRLVLERLHRVGLDQVLVFDLERQDCRIPVVKVIVPGLEPYALSTYMPGPRALAFASRGGQ